MSDLSALEQETIITYNKAEKVAELYTADPNVIRKMDKLVNDYPDYFKVTATTIDSKTYEFSKKFVYIRKPVTKVYTEEEKQALKAHLDAIRPKNNGGNNE